jgi:flagellar protein FlaG
MALEAVSGSSHNSTVKPEIRVPNVKLFEQIPNISFGDKQVPEILVGANPNLNESIQVNEKNSANAENKIKRAISEANNKLKFTRTKCEFTYFEDINRVAIKVIDRDTEEIIREIPPEETLELIQKLWEFAGLIYDEKR